MPDVVHVLTRIHGSLNQCALSRFLQQGSFLSTATWVVTFRRLLVKNGRRWNAAIGDQQNVRETLGWDDNVKRWNHHLTGEEDTFVDDCFIGRLWGILEARQQGEKLG